MTIMTREGSHNTGQCTNEFLNVNDILSIKPHSEYIFTSYADEIC